MMKIKEFDKLEKKLNGQNFHESYDNINKVMTGLSYFGHVASIFLAFFMLSKVLFGVMENQVVVYVVTVIILSAIELLKRDIFHKFSVLYLKIRAFTKDVLPLFLLSVTIIGISFYSSIKGAGEYSHKGDKIDQDFKTINKNFEDSVAKIYQPKVDVKEKEKATKEKALTFLYDQQRELNAMALSEELGPTKKKLLKAIPVQIKALEADNKPFIDQKNSEIKVIKDEWNAVVKKHHDETKKESRKKKSDNSSNSVAFIIFSTLIEISILAGVYFNDYYDVRSYREKRDQLEKDPNFLKWKLYNQILEIIYTEETKMNQKLQSNKGIIETCKMNDIIILPKDVTNFLKTMATLGIVKVSGSTRYINKLRDQAFESLGNHFGIE
jgi:hypothetical protein